MCSVSLLSLPLLNVHHRVYNSSHNLYSYILAKTISVHKCRITTGNYTAFKKRAVHNTLLPILFVFHSTWGYQSIGKDIWLLLVKMVVCAL